MRKGVMQLASIGALFAAMSSAAQGAAMKVDELKDALGEVVPNRRRRSRKGKGKRGRSLRSNSPSLAYISRQRTKRRWLAGLPVDADAREALEAAQAERERKNAKRARMMRRTGEGQALSSLAIRGRALTAVANAHTLKTDEGVRANDLARACYLTWRRLLDKFDNDEAFTDNDYEELHGAMAS